MDEPFELVECRLRVGLAVSFAVAVVIDVILVAGTVDFERLEVELEILKGWLAIDAQHIRHQHSPRSQVTQHDDEGVHEILKGSFSFLWLDAHAQAITSFIFTFFLCIAVIMRQQSVRVIEFCFIGRNIVIHKVPMVHLILHIFNCNQQLVMQQILVNLLQFIIELTLIIIKVD